MATIVDRIQKILCKIYNFVDGNIQLQKRVDFYNREITNSDFTTAFWLGMLYGADNPPLNLLKRLKILETIFKSLLTT